MKQLLLAAAVLTLGQGVSAEEYGTPEEAKAILVKAAAEVGADASRAFHKFNANDPEYRDRDLFVFCFQGSDGKFSAHEAMVTMDVRKLRDQKGKDYGEQMFERAREGEITEIGYVSPFPGTIGLVPKRAFVTRTGAYVCGVSVYLYNGPGTPTE